MKLIIYQLTAEGKIPDYVTDGGYFPNPNGQLVGVANSDAPADAFTEASFKDYVLSFCSDYTDPRSEEVIPIALVAQNFWNDKMVN